MEERNWLIIAGLLILVLVLFGGGGMMGGGMSFMMIFWIILLVALVYLLTDKGKATREKSAKELLDERYAKGEMSTEEYRRMKEALK